MLWATILVNRDEKIPFCVFILQRVHRVLFTGNYIPTPTAFQRNLLSAGSNHTQCISSTALNNM